MTPEGKIKHKVRKALTKFGPLCKPFMPVQTGYGAATLDLLVCVNGRFVAIETKADKTKHLTERQQQTAQAYRDAGALVFVVCDDETLNYMMRRLEWIACQNLLDSRPSIASKDISETPLKRAA